MAIVNRVPNKSVSFADMSSWLAANDFYLWKDKKRVGEGKTMLLREHPGKRVSNKGFSEAREQCKWWKKVKFPRTSAASCLNAEEWEKLRHYVRKFEDQIRDRPIEEAVLIVSTACPTNKRLLQGLNSDLQFWIK